MPTSVQSLPSELLVDIFKVAIGDNGDHGQRACLVLVSKLWCTIIYDSPLLWTTITSLDFGYRATLTLTKSQALPLDVTLPNISHPSIQTENTIKEICGHLHRWRTGWLQISTLLWWPLQTPAPLLETLYIDCVEGPTMVGPMDLFQGHAPRLRSVHLGRVAIPWSNGLLSGLDMLELDRTPSAWCPTLEQLTSILVASPHLTVLHLRDTDYDWPSEDDDAPTAISISLPHLQVLHLSELQPIALCQILSRIESPPCRELDVSCEVQDEEDLSFLASLAGFVPHTPSNNSKIDIFIQPARVEYYLSSPPDQECSISLECFDPAATARHLAQNILPPYHLLVDTKLTLWRYDHPMIDVLDWMEGADGLRITSLDISGTDQILERLARRIEGRWLFPALSEMTLEVRDVNPGVLTHTVKCRNDEAGSGLAQLVSLTLNNVYEEHLPDVAAVEEILGSDRVSWSY